MYENGLGVPQNDKIAVKGCVVVLSSIVGFSIGLKTNLIEQWTPENQIVLFSVQVAVPNVLIELCATWYSDLPRFVRFSVIKAVEGCNLEQIYCADELIYLRELGDDDISDRYISWLNDSEINKYLDTRFSKHDFESVQDFVRMNKNSKNDYLLGIFTADNDVHIGNIKLGRINEHNKRADISYLIGDMAWWGKGVATRAIGLVCRLGFETFGLEKLTAGVYQFNLASEIVLERNGFVVEGVRREQGLFGDRRADLKLFGLLRKEWLSKNY